MLDQQIRLIALPVDSGGGVIWGKIRRLDDGERNLRKQVAAKVKHETYASRVGDSAC